MQVIYAKETIPHVFSKSIFLCGPTPRSADVASWRPYAIKLLEEACYDGIVFVPEGRDGKWKAGYDEQVEWEEKCLHMADCILFWIPRNLTNMLALTTNIEWGVWQDSGKVVFGAPPNAERIHYQRYYAEKLGVPQADSLQKIVDVALKQIGEGVLRKGGEREVPLHIWRTPYFQQWYKAQHHAGNRLDGAKVVWTFRVGPKRNFVFFWALHVNVYVASEDRHKTNEVIIARPDIATVLMYHRRDTFDETEVVLIREFRSPAITDDGFIHELPGGSSFKPNIKPKILAATECKQETGLDIEPARFTYHGSRQLVGTVSTHQAHLFSVELTETEMDSLISCVGIAYGVAEETERTYVEITTLGKIKHRNNVDWSMLGMILSVIV